MILTTGALFQAEDNRWFLINHHARFLAAFDFVLSIKMTQMGYIQISIVLAFIHVGSMS